MHKVSTILRTANRYNTYEVCVLFLCMHFDGEMIMIVAYEIF